MIGLCARRLALSHSDSRLARRLKTIGLSESRMFSLLLA
jgi:hypothetical protein